MSLRRITLNRRNSFTFKICTSQNSIYIKKNMNLKFEETSVYVHSLKSLSLNFG